MKTRYPFLSVLLPIVLASGGCIGTEADPSSEGDELTSSDDSSPAVGNEQYGTSTDYLMQMEEPCEEGSCGSGGKTPTPTPMPAPKKAMTWSLLSSATSNGKAYALPGADAVTNAYQGDTWTNNTLPLLCIKKNNPPHPGAGVIGSPVQTPGGAWRRTWSGGTVALTAPVTGTSLTSRAAADALCASQIGAGYRFAEFHDGDPAMWSGWDFWGAALNAKISPFQGTRFWVSINDQNANPW